jgi:hypothetical protein
VGALAVVIALLSAGLAGAAPSADGPPKEPECLSLVAGTGGLPFIGGSLPSLDPPSGQPAGFGPVALPAVRESLPDRVVFKDQDSTFSTSYAFALREGRIYVRRAKAGKPMPNEPWHLLKLPACLDGHITAISADGNLLLALGRGRQIYANDMPSGAPSASAWTWRWGPPFWAGAGAKMFSDVRRWATSTFGPPETFTDSSGRSHEPIGVATVYLMRDRGRRITYLDPWLPPDESREVCSPRRGTLPLANLSASGSTVLAIGQRGELFTRLYDFDLSGANTVFGDYSWRRPRPASDTRWQMPPAGWQHQPRPPGTVTDRISIATNGPDASDRLLVVEGRDERGRPGRFEKQIDARRWKFTASGDELHGRRLPLAHPVRSGGTDRLRYAGTIDGRPAVVTGFSPECSPARLRIAFGSGTRLDLILHSSDGLRQTVRPRGLTDIARNYNGAIEVPKGTLAGLDSMPAQVRQWVADNLTPGRFTTSPLAVTATRMQSISLCWQLTLNGKPARPDDAAAPPDPGMVVGWLTEMARDGRPPGLCL